MTKKIIEQRKTKRLIKVAILSIAFSIFIIQNAFAQYVPTVINPASIINTNSQLISGMGRYPVEFVYSYDLNGNRVSENGIYGIKNYVYDDENQLLEVRGSSNEDYTYDPTGNRTIANGTTYTSNPLNQYIRVGTTGYRYDANGNMILEGSQQYVYDEEDRLTSTINGNQVAVYEYNGLDQRISQTINGDYTRFIYDGDRIIEEYDAQNQNTASYIYGPGIDEVLLMVRGGNEYYYIYDGQGSVAQLIDERNTTLETYIYDAYGNPNQPSQHGNPYLFTGRRYDTTSNLYHYRARAYHPTLGRFLQRDPIGFSDDINLYRYVKNNPINYIDPTGETLWDIAGFGADVFFFQDSLKNFKECPGLGTGINLALDSLSFLPIVPTLGFVTRADDVFDASRRFNPFKGKNVTEIDQMFRKKGFELRGPDPLSGKGTYVNPKTGRGYHLDANHPAPKPPHVGVQRPRGNRNLPTRDFDL